VHVNLHRVGLSDRRGLRVSVAAKQCAGDRDDEGKRELQGKLLKSDKR
jgi:hypothetical protein